jgi:hypothetical protein
VRAAPGASAKAYEMMTKHPMFMYWRAQPDLVGRTLEACGGDGIGVAELAARLEEPVRAVVERLARLAKMELVTLEPGAAPAAEV